MTSRRLERHPPGHPMRPGNGESPGFIHGEEVKTEIPIADPSRPPGVDATQAHEQHELLRWVAELYYVQQQGQAEIATLIGASVSKVSRLLAEARRQSIVTIQVAATRVGDSEFERALAQQLGLQAVYVARRASPTRRWPAESPRSWRRACCRDCCRFKV